MLDMISLLSIKCTATLQLEEAVYHVKESLNQSKEEKWGRDRNPTFMKQKNSLSSFYDPLDSNFHRNVTAVSFSWCPRAQAVSPPSLPCTTFSNCSLGPFSWSKRILCSQSFGKGIRFAFRRVGCCSSKGLEQDIKGSYSAGFCLVKNLIQESSQFGALVHISDSAALE